MNCSNCGLKMVQSGTGFLCPSCGHTELTPNVTKAKATSLATSPPQKQKATASEAIVPTSPAARATVPAALQAPSLNPAVASPIAKDSVPAVPAAKTAPINSVPTSVAATPAIPVASPAKISPVAPTASQTVTPPTPVKPVPAAVSAPPAVTVPPPQLQTATTKQATGQPANPAPTIVAEKSPSVPAATVPALEITNLSKSYGNVKVVDNLSFKVPQGMIFGLLGPNGSGKTTTINMISGLSGQTSGEVRIMGLDVTRSAKQVHSLLGFVPQETSLYEELSAWKNMDFHADLFGVPRSDKKARITSLLEMVQLLDRRDSLVRTFSGGMKRRLAIARALLHEPKLIYLDEPTIGVDVQARRVIWNYILALREQGKTILITTNYLEEAQELCDELAIIDHGKLIVLETPDRLKELYGGRVIEVETVDPANALNALSAIKAGISTVQNGNHFKISLQGEDSLVAQVVNLLAQKNEIRKISVREPDLDEIFLKLTGSALRD